MDFYKIDENYIKFLQRYELQKRGITKVPNIKYSHRNKFSFGAVLEINHIKYYVSVSSFSKSQEANILIKIAGDSQEIKGSLRFNYMIPVPDACLTRLVIKDITDEKYRTLLNKEFRFCQENADRIQKKAEKIYNMIINNRKQVLTDNSCDFRILEQGYIEYTSKYLTNIPNTITLATKLAIAEQQIEKGNVLSADSSLKELEVKYGL